MVPKFRAWDKKTKEYFHICELWNSGANPECFNFYGWTDNFGGKGRLKDIAIEQYTGIQDANGKEIYEGDILATSSKIGGELIADYLKVDWREDYAGFFCGETPLYACLSEWDNDIKYPQTFPEIVGNVHENPELLEAQHD